MKLFWLVLVALVLCACVVPPVEAGSFPVYDVDVCTTSIGWITDDGVMHTGGMCEQMYPGYESTLWDTVSIVPLIDWGEEWGIMGDYAHSAWLPIPEGMTPHQVADNWISEDIERRWLARGR